MTTERWQRVKELLHQAIQLMPERRTAFLDDACSAEPALRAEVESLLFADANIPSDFMQQGPVAAGDSGGALEAGQTFAQHYRLVSKLGEGGMGQVWLAEQTFPVRRQVALKLIKAGMYDEAVVQRFQSERQSLAIMDHPAIAKVFDAGATSQGQPYFIMEFVPGLPITEYCDQKKLSIRKRLELFVQACEGVQHAHQKAIVHRDLKPPNILVVEVDGRPVPRIIDFGLAKATSPQIAGESLFTQLGQFLGTPGYMSPEQIDLSSDDVDTRTDVYSLGVVLYVLLTGRLPFESKLRQKQPLDELLRTMREEEPPSASAKVQSDRDSAAATAEARGTEPKQLVSLLRGDLDGITRKALERDRNRRYGTPSELAGDIRRYMNHEPVLARPASARYRLQKYVRRHRVAVATTTGLIVLLASFSVLQGLELRRTTQERDRANAERDRATRITDFMTGMFKVSDPSEARGNSITAREILDKASNEMDIGLAQHPEVQSQMMQVMARTYQNLGLFPRAHDLAKRALDSRLRLLGPDDPKTLQSMTLLGSILDAQGDFAASEKLERQALVGERRVLGNEDPLTLQTMDQLAGVLGHEGQYADEDRLEHQVTEISTRRLGAENEQTLRAMANLGRSLWNQARFGEAEQEYRRVIELERRTLGPDHPMLLAATANLGLVLEGEGDFAGAEQLFRESLASAQRVLGPEHPSTALDMDHLANLLSTEGHLAEAEKMSREVLAIRTRILGPENARTLISKINLSDELFKEGRIQEAEALQREAVANQIRIFGEQDSDSLVFKSYLARTLTREGHYAEAEGLTRETYEVQRHNLGALHPDTLYTLRELGKAIAYSHRYAEASQLFREVIDKGVDGSGQGNRWTVWYAFACVAMAGNQPNDALQYLQEATDRGYRDSDNLMADDDLKSLRSNAKFKQMVAGLKRPVPGIGAP